MDGCSLFTMSVQIAKLNTVKEEALCPHFSKDGREIICKDSPKKEVKNKKSTNDRIFRLIVIHQMVKKGGYPTSEEIINACCTRLELEGYSAATKSRDFDFLRDYFRAPLEFDPFHKGYYYTDKNFTIDFDKITWI